MPPRYFLFYQLFMATVPHELSGPLFAYDAV
jgi:hypothetical protein